jgi:hypothetical protein
MKDLTSFNNKYKNLLIDTTNIHSDSISTVDHIYASPPLRLIDSHSKLRELKNTQIVIWDIIIPFEKKHRYELMLDSGLFSSKNKIYYFFDLQEYYFKSKLHKVDLMQQRNELEYVLSKVLSIGDKQRYLERFDKLADIYENAMSICHNVIEFYKILIRDLYLLLNMEDLGEFFYKNSISLYYSGLIDNYLPQIISSTSNQEFSLINLLEKSSIFKPPYFRSLETDIEINFENKNQIINNLDTIINLLRHKKIIPSNQIILWSLQLAGIRHFGNDFNFHDSMHSVLNSLAITNNVNSLQVTLPKQDGSNFVEFDNVKSYHIQNSGNKKRIVKTLTKKSRVNDIPNLYLHAGALVGDLWEEFNKSKITRKLNMGKLL